MILNNKLRVILGVLLLLGGQTVWADKKIEAEWVETLLDSMETLRNYSRMVVYDDSIKQISIRADSLHVRLQSEFYAFIGAVAYRDSLRQVQADTLVYIHHEGRAEFRGRVFLQDQNRKLWGQWVDYDTRQGLLIAKNQLHFENPSLQHILTGNRLFYDLKGDSGWAIDNPRFALANATQDTFNGQADSIYFSGRVSQSVLLGNAQIHQGHMIAWAGRVEYTDSLVILDQTPHISYLVNGNRDSIFGKANRIFFKLENRRIQSIHFEDQAEIHMVVADSQKTRRRIWANKASVQLTENAIASLEATGQVCVFMTDTSANEMDLKGQKLELAFIEGKPDSLILSENTESVYISENNKTKSLIWGEIQALWFEEQRLLKMIVEHQARCQNIPEQGEQVFISGDQVSLVFDQGQVKHIQSHGGVRGAYHYSGEKKE